MKWLVREARADVDRANADTGQSPLSMAGQTGKLDVVQFLIEAGADLNATSVDGGTPLFVCAQQGQAAAARQAHADVNLSRIDGASPLFSSVAKGSTAVIRLLLAAGADVEQAEEKSMRSLALAAQLGHAASVRLLLGAGANVNARGYISCTALYWASMYGHVACVRLLLCYGRADMSLIGDAPNDEHLRDVICTYLEANNANAPAIRAHFDMAERWEREREAAMRDGLATCSRRRQRRSPYRVFDGSLQWLS